MHKPLALVATFLIATLLILAQGPSMIQSLKPNTFKRIFIVVFENQALMRTMLYPNFMKYAKMGTLLTQSYAVCHPSQPNYIAMIAGDHFNLFHDDNVNVTTTTVVDLMEAKGISWKTYQENYSGKCNMDRKIDAPDGAYYRKHNPFISIENIFSNPERCAKIVDSDQLWTDIKNRDLPQYMFYTPNIKNDCHDTGLRYCDNYLPKLMEPLLADPYFMDGTMILITFDEDGFPGVSNNIYTALIGHMVPAGGVDRTPYTHYSIIKSIEENWELGSLGRNDVNATAFVGLKDPSMD